MFTGIVETTGVLIAKEEKSGATEFEIKSSITSELKIDQSISHNGVCLTVTKISGDHYFVTAIPETLKKTALGDLVVGNVINLERSMAAGGRFDGHIVQGHVDQTAICTSILKEGDSFIFTFNFDASLGNFTVEKGSICVNGISLTVFNSKESSFSVAIIPYTFEHTNIGTLKEGSRVNLEFDVVGKYLQTLFMKYNRS